jgi:hypothetical protein
MRICYFSYTGTYINFKRMCRILPKLNTSIVIIVGNDHLTLLWIDEESYVNSTMYHGVNLTPYKKFRIKAQFITMFFSQTIFYNTGLCSNIDKQTRLCLGTFEYTEADREMWRKWITKSKQYSTTLHVWVSDYFTHSIITCRSFFITVRYITLRTSQNLTK